MQIKDIGEIGLIKRFAKRIRLDKSVIKGSGDDAAVIRWTKDKYLLFTCDMTVEDVHFRRSSAAPFQIGYKAMARNISDIAAMGGVPRYAVVSIGLKPNTGLSVVDGIFRGISSLSKKYGINIVGGDIARSEKIVIDISMIGEVERENLALRSGARPGDIIFVTGSIGGSQKGKHLGFTPRLEEARLLVKKFNITSMIDVSDGLLLDLSRILKASKVGARIYQSLVPLSKLARSFEKAVIEGEDFELLFTARAEDAVKITTAKFPARVTQIGSIVDKNKGFKIITKNGKEKTIKPKGFLHF